MLLLQGRELGAQSLLHRGQHLANEFGLRDHGANALDHEVLDGTLGT